MSQTETEMCQVNLNGLAIEVDWETALLLKSDPVFKNNYEKAVIRLASQDTNLFTENDNSQEEFQSLINLKSSQDTNLFSATGSDSQEESQSLLNPKTAFREQKLLWTTKKATTQDVEATGYLLKLRKDLAQLFDDQKHSKSTLWQQIAKELNNKMFFVGEGTEGAEKCRKKMSNLQAAYMKYKDRRRQTGEGFISKPPFYAEIEEILGQKDKVAPQIIIDSTSRENVVKEKTESISEAQQPELNDNAPSPGSSLNNKNRFESIKASSKPQKDTWMKELISIHKEEVVERREEFNRIMKFLETSSQQRHEQVMAILNDKKKAKKRPRESDSDE